MNISKFCSMLLAGLVLAAGSAVYAWDWTRPFESPQRKVVTLIITGNYKRPLALAQLIQAENRQPYLLVPAKESGETSLFFCPAGTDTKALEIKPNDLSRFVALLNPAQILIIGDTRYVPECYEPQLDGKIPVVRIVCSDWQKMAEALGRTLNLNNISGDYARIAPKLEAKALYAPIPKAKPAPAAPESPAAPALEAAQETPAVGEVTPAENPVPEAAPEELAPEAAAAPAPVAEEK